ncbi:unnamed protein product, partial [marine sediment metagenome]
FWEVSDPGVDKASALDDTSIHMQLTRDSQVAIQANDDEDMVIPRMVELSRTREVGTSAAQHSETITHWPKEIIVQDGKGDGIIYAGKNLYLGLDTINAAVVVAGYIMILYRLVKVDIREFLGEILM